MKRIRNIFATNGTDENETRRMLETPITGLARLIGRKWVLPLDRLAEKADVPLGAVLNAVRGESVRPGYERKIRKFLEKL